MAENPGFLSISRNIYFIYFITSFRSHMYVVCHQYVIGGTLFINFISTVATCRIPRKARTAGLLSKMSYSELMEDLSSAWRKVDGPLSPSSDDSYGVHALKIVFEELEALELSKFAPFFLSRELRPSNYSQRQPRIRSASSRSRLSPHKFKKITPKECKHSWAYLF